MMRPLTELQKSEIDVYTGRCRIGPDAAREIARRIQGDHGFWDYEERRRSFEAAQPAEAPVVVSTRCVEDVLDHLVKQWMPGEEPAELAA